jgi:hypothetical protein
MLTCHPPKYIISEFYEFGASREMIMEAEKNFQPIIMQGIMQKANVLNRNGRVYPREILEREVNKYMESVRKNIATGELDHPDCQSPDSQILTSHGWKFWKDVSDDEVVATLNVDTSQIEYQKIEKKIDTPYKGEMFHFKGKNIDQMVTPNHRFLIEDRRGKRFYKTAAELFDYRDNKWKIPKKGEWVGEEMDAFTIPSVKPHSNFPPTWFSDKCDESISVKAEDWFEFMGWYLSEGTSSGVDGGDFKQGRQYISKITQKKESTKTEIKALFDRLPFDKRIVDYGDGKVDFVFTDLRLHSYLYALGNSHNKYIPEEMKQASPRLLKILFDAFMKGDGRNVRQGQNGEWTKKSVFSTSERLIHDLHEILLKIGGCGNISEWQPKDRVINEWKQVEQEVDNGDGTLSLVIIKQKVARVINAESSVKQYNLNLSSTDYIYLDKRMMTIEKVDYDDRVYCVRVKNGNFYTMRNGKAHWTGNSAIVSLSNVSHKVTELWWEGDTLYGKVQIAETPSGNILKGLLKSGIQLGISSRGVGSVKEHGDKAVVQEDFELIAFDFVSSPSTPGAWLFRESKLMRPLKVGDDKHVAMMAKYADLKELQGNNFWKNL